MIKAFYKFSYIFLLYRNVQMEREYLNGEEWEKLPVASLLKQEKEKKKETTSLSSQDSVFTKREGVFPSLLRQDKEKEKWAPLFHLKTPLLKREQCISKSSVRLLTAQR